MDRLDIHRTAIATLTDATTTHELAAALDGFTKLDQPGFPNDLPDGRYFDGAFFATMTGGHLAVTQMRDLPDRTADLWAQLDQEQRDQREQELLVAEQRRGRGRPAVGRAIPIRLPQWQIDALDRDAAAAGTGRAELVRALIAAAYATIRRDAAATGVDHAEQIRTMMHGRTAAMTIAAQVLATESTYHVEIKHLESDAWTHIHGIDWETTDSYPDAWIYALEVARDRPESRVRLVESDEFGVRYLALPEVI